MSTDTKQRQAAKAFAAKWKGQGYEKGQSPPWVKEAILKITQTYTKMPKEIHAL